MAGTNEGLCGLSIVKFVANNGSESVDAVTSARPNGEPYIEKLDDEKTVLLVKCGRVGCATQCVLVNAFEGMEERKEELVVSTQNPATIVDICEEVRSIDPSVI